MKNREYRNISQPFMVSADNKRIESDFYVEGFATTFDNPYLLYEYYGIKYHEIIDRKALSGADVSDVIMKYDHQGKVLARLSNNTLGIEATENGLLAFADLSKSVAARELYNEIDVGLITKMSWAFTIDDDEYDSKTHTRKINKIKKIYDVSAVSMPANDNTSISARSFIDGVIEKEAQELRMRLEITKKKYYYFTR